MSPSGIEAAFCCGWLAAVGAHTCLQSWARHFKTHAFLVIALHCFCRSDETEKNITHFFDFGVGASTTTNQQHFEDLHRFFV